MFYDLERSNQRFQLTASRRGWLVTLWKHPQTLIFQLTASRRGWPTAPITPTATTAISTHSLTKRLTFSRHAMWLELEYFNSQPHEEADAGTLSISPFSYHFNSQPHEEADICRLQSRRRQIHFNSQPHEEADWRPLSETSYSSYFNSQPHEEADDYFWNLIQFIVTFQLTASRRGWPG